MDELPKSKEELEAEFTSLSQQLEMIGLSTYEARAYIALIAHGYGTVEVIAETAKIPRTSAYKVLEGLQAKGFAISAHGRPMIFRPESPGKILKKVSQQIRSTFEKLELFHDIVREKGAPILIFTIVRKDRVIDKIGELLDAANQTFMICTPSFMLLEEPLEKNLKGAIARGVEITVITDPEQVVKSDGVKFFSREGLLATDVICDNQQALIASPELSTCGYLDNPLIAEHIQKFVELMIEHK